MSLTGRQGCEEPCRGDGGLSLAMQMRKVLAIAAILFLMNLLLGVTYIRFSPVCYSYARDQFGNVSSIASLMLAIPVYWVLGLVTSPPIIGWMMNSVLAQPLRTIERPLVWSLSGAMATTTLLLFWRRHGRMSRVMLIGSLCTCVNFCTLECLFLSMGV